jgi:hypothetical protein
MGAISGEEEAVLARLDAAFAEQKAALSERQVAVVRAWQRTDREYELAQAVARSWVDLDRMPGWEAAAALDFQQELDDAIETGRLPFDLTVYRGVRSLRRTFGVDAPEHISLGAQQFDGCGHFGTPAGCGRGVHRARRGVDRDSASGRYGGAVGRRSGVMAVASARRAAVEDSTAYTRCWTSAGSRSACTIGGGDR